MKFIDCKGLICPMPLIETKKALKTSEIGDEILVEVDNETSFNNLSHFLLDNGYLFDYSKEGIVYKIHFKIQKLQAREEKPKLQVNNTSNLGNYIIVLNSNCIGSGDDELGKLLMKGYLNTLDQLEYLPQEIICYNSGVTLAVKNSDTAKSLKRIEEKGVKISLCGTCVDFFGLKDTFEVGSITNMLYIAGKIAGDIRIVKP